ncbi:MAG: aldehyde ferredoxin oxidoreductase family protein [bacterium]
MPYGYNGKLLRINLTEGTITTEDLSDTFVRTYMGGKGFSAYYMLNEIKPDVDPLGPDNKLIFATGVLTGTPIAAMPRYVVGAKSPLTGGFGQSEAGGFFGPELKMAGFDIIIVEGKAPNPVYIYIKDGNAQFRDATGLWGLDTGDAEAKIRTELNDNRIRVAIIGAAGENLVKYACILNERKHANGRGGLGAVMGSKNLKAIAVRGTKKLTYKDEDTIKELRSWYNKFYMKHPLSYGLYNLGTAGGVVGLNASGILPTENFTKGYFAKAEEIDGQKMADTILKKREGCYACPIRCKRAVEIKEERFEVHPEYGGPEYETLGAFGSLCCVDDLNIICRANELCNRYTIDTISTGVSIAFAMECYEKGIITEKDTGGIKLHFGNAAAILELIPMIARREGFGNTLADGIKIMADNWGPEAQAIAVQSKGQEVPMHDPRGKTGLALQYAFSETGADHMVAAHDPFFATTGRGLDSIAPLGILEPVDSLALNEEKVRLFVYLELLWSFYDVAGICKFGPAPRGSFPLTKMIELLQAVTGWDTSLWEVMKVGERATNMARVFNIRAGLTAENDTVPERFFTELENGNLAGASISRTEFAAAKALYYEMMGWDPETSAPKRAKLIELGLKWLT